MDARDSFIAEAEKHKKAGDMPLYWAALEDALLIDRTAGEIDNGQYHGTLTTHDRLEGWLAGIQRERCRQSARKAAGKGV
jgi:hypothetical protein